MAPADALRAASPAPEFTLRQLAHELNSLLDGSMRCIGMARTSLQRSSHASAAEHTRESADDGLGKAISAMKHMAALLQRAMRLTVDTDVHSAMAMFHTEHTLRETLMEITHITQPMAGSSHVTLEISVSEICQSLPAGPLGVVVLNGVRNAIESCANASAEERRNVRVTVDLDDKQPDTLSIVIDDTGGGGGNACRDGQPARTGHGIGLSLSQQIVRELGGEIGLLLGGCNGQSGASLRITVPVRSLQRHG